MYHVSHFCQCEIYNNNNYKLYLNSTFHTRNAAQNAWQRISCVQHRGKTGPHNISRTYVKQELNNSRLDFFTTCHFMSRHYLYQIKSRRAKINLNTPVTPISNITMVQKCIIKFIIIIISRASNYVNVTGLWRTTTIIKMFLLHFVLIHCVKKH